MPQTPAARVVFFAALTLGFALPLIVEGKSAGWGTSPWSHDFAHLGLASSLAPERPARLFVAVALLLILPSAGSHRKLTMGQIGSYPERPEHSAWNDFGDVNRLLLAASQRPDVCGLRVDIAHLAWTGGSTYLHRHAPLYMPGTPNRPRRYNYVIAWAGSGAEVIARDGPLELVRLGDFECAPDERYPWRLP